MDANLAKKADALVGKSARRIAAKNSRRCGRDLLFRLAGDPDGEGRFSPSHLLVTPDRIFVAEAGGLRETLQSPPLAYLQRRDSGEIVARVMHDTSEPRRVLVDSLPYLLVNAPSFVGTAVILLRMDTSLALIVFLRAPFLAVGAAWFRARLMPQHSSTSASASTTP